MNHLEDHADTEMTRQLRHSLAEIPVAGQPAVGDIVSHGRARRRRRIAGTAGFGVAAIAATGALTLGLTGAFAGGGAGGSSGGGTTVRETAFTLTAHANGTDSLTLNRDVVFNPKAFARALAKHGIPAVVVNLAPKETTGACRFLTEQDTFKVVSAAGQAHVASASGQGHLQTMTIKPAAIPAGAELYFGYFDNDHTLVPALVKDGCAPAGS